MSALKSEYYKHIKPKLYQTTTTLLDAVISKIQNHNALGIDGIIGLVKATLFISQRTSTII